MLDLSQRQHPTHGNDRQRITRAREAAEALFRPKRPVIDPSASVAAPAAAPSARRPRVLGVAAPAPGAAREKVETAIGSEPQATPAILPSQVGRIRAWVKYGMTIFQVAQVCGVPVGEVERLLRKG